MALSDDLREELAAIAPADECDRLAELSGLFHVAGRAHLRGRGSVDVEAVQRLELSVRRPARAHEVRVVGIREAVGVGAGRREHGLFFER